MTYVHFIFLAQKIIIVSLHSKIVKIIIILPYNFLKSLKRRGSVHEETSLSKQLNNPILAFNPPVKKHCINMSFKTPSVRLFSSPLITMTTLLIK